ncbi:autotransporter domain-containing protein [Selenomonadales bacterium OttesenSCG-928-I06]|nr:autotransporter domain-containing protein [Selenomonadales bacterium OttesenSCG-928-I06]
MKGAILCANLSALIFFGGTGIIDAASDYGGAYNISGEQTINDENFEDYTVTREGGVIYVSATGELTLNNVSFINNAASDYGGAISTRGNITGISEGTFKGNTAEQGGAIYNRDTIGTLKDLSFTENKAVGSNGSSGGAIYNSGAISGLDTVSFTKNKATNEGGAIFSVGNSTIGFLNNVNFIENEAKSGGAIFGSQVTIGEITNGNFTGNKVTDAGGAIHINYTGTIGLIDTVSFKENEAGNGGAINTSSTSIIQKISNVDFDSNKARYAGGAIYTNANIVTIDTVSFTKNTSSAGGAINLGALGDSTIDTLKNASFTENKAANEGGALYIAGKLNNLNMVSFSRNESTNDSGGAIYNFSSGTIGSINTVSFTENTAVHGGGIFNYGTVGAMDKVSFTGNKSTHYGGAIYNSATAKIGPVNTVDFIENTAAYGGGIYNYGTMDTIDKVSFAQNNADSGGGGIYNASTLSGLTEVIFTENKAGSWGGAIYNAAGSSKINFLNTVSFIRNEAANGGAIYNYLGTIVSMNNVDFIENTADYGGAIYNYNIINDLNKVSFIRNEATNYGGAIFNNNTITINSGLFSGNLANQKASSIYNNAGNLIINPDEDEILDLRDPMSGSGGTITKTGEGSLLVGGNNEFTGSTKINVNEGTLYLYRENEVTNSNKYDINAKVKSGSINLSSASSEFKLGSDAKLVLGIGDIAHYITADKLAFESGSSVSVNYDTALVTRNDVFDNAENRYDVLYLDSGILDNKSTVVNKDGILEAGAYDYEVEAKWNDDDGKDIFSLYAKDSGEFNPDRGGSNIVRIPESIAIHNPTNEVIINRQKSLFTDKEGVFGDIKKRNRHFWGTGFYNFTNMDQQGNIPGYNLKIPGFALGYDDYVTERQFLGVAVTASWPDYHGGNASADGNDIRLAVYGGAKLNHNWELSYMAGYGWADLDQNRHYKGYRYNADYNFDTLSFAVGLAKQFKRSESSFVRPYVHYEYMKIDVDGYTENGEGQHGLGLESRDSDIDRVRVGFDYVKQSKENENKYWRAGLFWQGQYGDTTPKARAYFISNPLDSRFISYGGTEDRDSLGVTLGWGTPIGKNSDFHVSYTGLYGSDANTQDFSMTFVRRF